MIIKPKTQYEYRRHKWLLKSHYTDQTGWYMFVLENREWKVIWKQTYPPTSPVFHNDWIYFDLKFELTDFDTVPLEESWRIELGLP